MGKVIEFYQHPNPKRYVAPSVPTKAEFDAQVAEENLDVMPAGDVLQQLLDRKDTIQDVLVMLRDADGGLGFVTNLADVVEAVHFIERVKFQILKHEADMDSLTGPPKGAS